MGSGTDRTYLGLDLSTQQLKAVVIDDNLEILHQAFVHFDSDLPEFRTHGGVVQDKTNQHVITVPTIMWVKALDMLMDRLIVSGVDFSKIAAVSGSAQQHGSVYWQTGSNEILKNLDSSQFLHHQLASTFSIFNSPIWMDSSTEKQCRILEEGVGGPQKLAEITGSRAYERFTGSQICKIAQTRNDTYNNTERITLVSNFACSLFLGEIAPIDISDASGMNLMDIKTRKWYQQLLDLCGPELGAKLGDPVPSHTCLGNISSYYVDRWDFNEDCKVICFTGDNSASLIGMRLNEDCLGVSLGTSDTLFLWLKEPHVLLDGHILCNPLDEKAYMALLCFKNASLTRERIRDATAEGSWDIFNQLLDSTPRGNFGNLGLYFDTQEILPFLMGDYRFNRAGERIGRFSSLEVEVRALIEGQFVAKRAYAEDMGLKIGADSKILATGGASCNKAILQVLADVFNTPVYTLEATNAAMLGAAYQAKIGLMHKEIVYKDIFSTLPQPNLICEPYKDSDDIYKPMMKRYRTIIASLVQ